MRVGAQLIRNSLLIYTNNILVIDILTSVSCRTSLLVRKVGVGYMQWIDKWKTNVGNGLDFITSRIDLSGSELLAAHSFCNIRRLLTSLWLASASIRKQTFDNAYAWVLFSRGWQNFGHSELIFAKKHWIHLWLGADNRASVDLWAIEFVAITGSESCHTFVGQRFIKCSEAEACFQFAMMLKSYLSLLLSVCPRVLCREAYKK